MGVEMEGKKQMGESPKRCLACQAPLSRPPLLVLENMPSSAQEMPGLKQLPNDQPMALRLCQCQACGLVQFDCQPVAYYRDVIRSGGFSTTMVELRKKQYRQLIGTFHLEGKRFLEVGCGRGEFLSVLASFPVECRGVEHRASLVDLAVAQGLSVFQGFAETPETILEGRPYDAFLSFNFLEHQPDPVAMLRCIWNNLSQEGVGLVTVPSLEYILEHDGYYELVRDHLAYYDFHTLRHVLALSGFQVVKEEVVNRDTLSAMVKKVAMPAKEIGPAPKPINLEGLRRSSHDMVKEIGRLVERLESQGKTLALWGAGHQGFTLAATTGLGGHVPYMVDSAPFKQGRFAPVSHIPIVAPEHLDQEPVDALLIVAPGYTEEIAGIIRQKFGGRMEILALKSKHVGALPS